MIAHIEFIVVHISCLVRFHRFTVHRVCSVCLSHFIPTKDKFEQHLVGDQISLTLARPEVALVLNELKLAAEDFTLFVDLKGRLLYHLADFGANIVEVLLFRETKSSLQRYLGCQRI
jgi:hypothetical protein